MEPLNRNRNRKPIVELGVDEAHSILVHHFAQTDLPPLDAIENEDWGRDLLLSRLLSFSADRLAEAGLTADDPPD